MNRSLELFEDISISNKDSKNIFTQYGISSPICFLIEGINDIQLFSELIQEKTNSKFKVIKILNELVLFSFNSGFDYFKKHIETELIIFHYNIYSIFLKSSYSNIILSEFKGTNENLIYLYYEDNLLGSAEIFSKKAKDIKFTSFFPKKFLYGFEKFSDLLEFYVEIIEERRKWPVYAILPSKVNYDQIHTKKHRISSNEFYSSSIYPVFSPIKFLHYISFIEKVPPKPNRILNATEIYSIKKIRDAQISHLNNLNSTIRTFLGFNTKFRCYQVFDFLKNKKENFIDFQLVDDDCLNIPKSIKPNLFYLELRSIFESSILFSINYKESFNFLNDSDGYSTFLSFENQEDFLVAKNLFKSFIGSNFLFKNMRIIEQENLPLLFPSFQAQSHLFYIMFQLKIINKNSFSRPKLPNFTSLFKKSIITKKDNICSLDNKPYIIVGFTNAQSRNESFRYLKNSKYLIRLKSYFPEKNPVNSISNIEKVENHTLKSKTSLFQPKEGLFYIYFQENQKSKINYPSNIINPLFGLQNISDVQRNYYLQNDPNEYTFIGFSRNEHLQKAVRDSSSKSNSLVMNILNGRIYNYQNNREIVLNINNYDNKENDTKFEYHYDNSKNNSCTNKNDERFHWSCNIDNNERINQKIEVENSVTNNNHINFDNNTSIDNNSNFDDHANIENNSNVDNNANDNNSNVDNNVNDNNANVNNVNVDNHNNIDSSNIANNNNKNKRNNNSNKSKNDKTANDRNNNITSINTKINNTNIDNNIYMKSLIINLKDYKKIKILGSGSYGKVYLVKNLKNSTIYAAKETNHVINTKENKGDFFNEIMAYSKVDNPAVLKLFGYSPYNFSHEPKPVLILEYMKNGSLDELLHNGQLKIDRSIKYIILLGTAFGMQYLHSLGIVHRDLKPANILLDDSLYPKICDFGCSYISDEKLSKIQMDEFIGTAIYM